MSGTPPLFSCKSISVKQGDGTWRANPLFSGNGLNGQALPHCGTCSSLRGAFDVVPVAEPCGGCQNISRLPQATEYQEYLAGTEMGVERTVLREGKGRSPKHAEMVQCHYIGTLVDGTEFDNSR